MNTRDIAAGYRLQRWVGIIRECKESGLSVKAFCANAGFHENSYYYWQKRLREAACESLAGSRGDTAALLPPGFAEAKLQGQLSLPSATAAGQAQVCVEAAGVRLTATGEYPADKLAALLRELRQPC